MNKPLGIGMFLLLILGIALAWNPNLPGVLPLTNQNHEDVKKAEALLATVSRITVYRDQQIHNGYVDGSQGSQEWVIDVPQDMLKKLRYSPEFILNKGGYPATLLSQDGATHLAIVSQYGSFLVIEGIPGYYSVPDSEIEPWKALLSIQ